jgi:D-3-phosphoglycerate dehydrogenase
MQCALEKRGGDALLIIGSDTEFPSEVLDQIRSSSNILSVKVANLS